MQRITRLIIVGVATIIIFKSTTFGWHSIFTSTVRLQPKDNMLPEKLKRHVVKLSNEIGDRNISNYENLKKTADYIVVQFLSYGYNVTFQKYSVAGKEVKNIIALKTGSRFPNEIILLGAHYDSCFNPGADDNASGISGLLELARMIANKKVDRTIEFIAFVNEEPPFFKTEVMGSRIYAKECKAENKNIRAIIVFDLIGFYSNKPFSQRYPVILGLFFPNKGNFIGVFGNFKSRYLARQITRIFKNNSSFPIASIALDFIPGIDFSDHWSFWKEGYPAVMISDTAFLRHKNYHKNTDTWEKLNYKDMACVIEGIYGVLVRF
ncbi:MAG: aminopeptidase [Candidatus Omnitrophica bacterium CG02_land_8_20_14_3_00__42_8]|nr:MAG: aminopeptidase [Candidatus Omnitrophica bacterium CG02_land_8_20_14_3_00__42_8]PIW68686.1 MAG: aminopeptidase [Candidatus Omnitrophica bacterium CG12_big_fil_rev_8_21_14_0_65_42_8]